MKTDTMDAALQTDAELVAASLAGQRDAFREIVERYQTLICSLAYCATGNLSQSEDLAQDTFLTAWNDLAALREPAKLRSWLCAIVRFRIGKQHRSQGRDPVHAAEPLEVLEGSTAPEPPPHALAISREETAILWRALERIPESYREPLVLFYREHQSIEAVAASLELSEDAVKQRLSRGRKLLQEQVLAFVEGSLERTRPGSAFTLGVLAALPISFAPTAKAAALAAAAKGGATAASSNSLAPILAALSGPGLGFLFGVLGWRESLGNTESPVERRLIKRHGLLILAGGILFIAACSVFSGWVSPRLWSHHPFLVVVIGWAICLSWLVFVLAFSWRQRRLLTRLRKVERLRRPDLVQADRSQPDGWGYRTRATLLGLPLIDWRSFGRARTPAGTIEPAVGWIASGEIAYGILYASGGIAVGGISTGGVSIGLVALGGCSIGLFALGGFALGAIALGGAAIGWIATGGLALGWHAAMGGAAAAHHLACGGAAIANHVNDPVAKEFLLNHPWLDFTRAATRNLFWVSCFGPMLVQMLFRFGWRRIRSNRTYPT